MAKAESIWSYIQAQNNSKNYRFVIRIPKDAQHAFNGQEKHTKSLKTWIKAEAEAKAYIELEMVKQKIALAATGAVIIDVSKKKALAELTSPERTAIEAMFDRFRETGWIITKANWNPSKTDLLTLYAEAKAGRHDDTLMKVLALNGIFMNPASQIFTHYRDSINTLHRELTAEAIKWREIEDAESIEPKNLPAFEAKMFETGDKRVARPMMSVTALWELYKAKKVIGSGSKREAEEITRFGNYVRDFSNFVGDIPVNHVTRSDVSRFFTALEKLPGARTVAERKMTFLQIVASDHGRDTITHKAAIEWYARLNRMFAWAENTYHDQFDIKNPFKEMKGEVKGADGTVKRAWEEEEIAALFEQPEFKDAEKRNSFFYSVLCGLAHGNRLSEFHNRKMTELKQDKNGVWYIDVVEGKNEDSERHVPISDIVIKAGFLEWVEKNKAAGSEYLFPDEDHNDPDSRKFSRDFGKWLQRRKLYNPARTLHNFRDTFLSAAYETAYPPEVMHPPLVARRVSGHASKDVHEDYIVIRMPAMKTVVDTVRIAGLPYERFT